MLKTTGIVRKLDELGRVVLPKELRRTFDLAEGDGVEVLVDNDRIVLRKYQPGCSCCGNIDIAVSIDKVKLCSACVDLVKRDGNE